MLPRLLGLALTVAIPGSALASPPSELLDRAAAHVELSRELAVHLSCIERVRIAEYDARGNVVRERSDDFHWDLERDLSRHRVVAVRAKASGRVVDGPDPTFGGLRWPDSHDWLGVVEPANRGFYLFRDLGPTSDHGLTAYGVGFRGALPFDRGEDVREWEGRLDLDPRTGRILGIEASPSSQLERGIRRYDAYVKKTRWTVMLFGGSLFRGRFGRSPTAASAKVRFQTSPEGTVIPGEVRYETLRFVRRGVTEVGRVQVRSYEDCRTARATSKARPAPEARAP